MFAPLLWLIIFALATKAAFSSSLVQLLRDNEKRQQEDYLKQIDDLTSKMKRMQKQIDYNRIPASYD